MKKDIIEYNGYEIDETTGEVLNELPPAMPMCQFAKIFPKSFIPVLSQLEGKQVQVFAYILEMMKPSDNLFLASYSKIEKDLHLSHQTVVKAMAVLKQADFIRPISNAQWMCNPNMYIKGTDNKRYILHKIYHKLK